MNQLVLFLSAAIVSGTPLLFATLGEIITEKSGNLNLGVEGMMLMGAVFGFKAGLISNNPYIAVLSGALGGILGGVLLAFSGEKLFRALVPFLILLASVLLALQEPTRRWMTRRQAASHRHSRNAEITSALSVGLAAVYGGYFGAGLSVIVLAVLGLLHDDSLTRLNALKQAVALATNVAAALFFVFTGQVVWSVALVMAVGALAGGALGGHMAGRIKPTTLRATVVTVGVLVALVYLLR
jgi:uncharacterized membrane protein YfcA